ncbi:MAG: hypothetical protein AAF443_02445 [Chlamydiota bacterium]
MQPYTKPEDSGFSKQKLVVALHGLNNGPPQFSKILDELEHINDFSDMALYVPCLEEKGNAKLDDIVRPILKSIKSWAKDPKDKELILLGVSNGARVAEDILAQLLITKSVENITQLQLISIVGANQGSFLASVAESLGLSRLFLSKNIATEMPLDSARNQRLKQELQEGINNYPNLKISYTFIAAPYYSDWQVPNYSSTLMPVDPRHTSCYAIIGDEGHNSIVNRSAKAIASFITGSHPFASFSDKSQALLEPQAT